MPSHTEHELVGAAVGVVMYSAYQSSRSMPPDPLEALLLVSAGALSGRLQDLLEPPTTPSHRGFFHTVLFTTAAGVFIYDRWLQPVDVPLLKKALAVTVLLALVSHLLLDARTAMGIKWV